MRDVPRRRVQTECPQHVGDIWTKAGEQRRHQRRPLRRAHLRRARRDALAQVLRREAAQSLANRGGKIVRGDGTADLVVTRMGFSVVAAGSRPRTAATWGRSDQESDTYLLCGSRSAAIARGNEFADSRKGGSNILDFSRRGKPTDNATSESFSGRFREEWLDVHWFASLDDAEQKIDAFRWDYNENHPHRALKGLSPNEYARLTMKPAAESL